MYQPTSFPEIPRHPLHRIHGQNDLHFITFSCFRRRPLLSSPSNRDCFVETLSAIRYQYHFLLLAYVVMPEHVHFIISESKRATSSTILQVIKQRVAVKLASTHAGEAFWQRRFYDFSVWSDQKLTEKLDYIHTNPIKRQLVTHPRDWPWSSWSNHTHGQGLIPIDQPVSPK